MGEGCEFTNVILYSKNCYHMLVLKLSRIEIWFKNLVWIFLYTCMRGKCPLCFLDFSLKREEKEGEINPVHASVSSTIYNNKILYHDGLKWKLLDYQNNPFFLYILKIMFSKQIRIFH